MSRSVLDCRVPGCGSPQVYRTEEMCNLHWQRWKRHGDPNIIKRGGGWVGDLANYHTAHKRITAERGSAGEHTCRNCGVIAAHWAYDGLDDAERLDERGLAFSLDADHYMPLCVSCHRQYDLNQRSGIPELKGSFDRTHCVNGHEESPANTYRHSTTGARTCRPCQRERHNMKKVAP